MSRTITPKLETIAVDLFIPGPLPLSPNVFDAPEPTYAIPVFAVVAIGTVALMFTLGAVCWCANRGAHVDSRLNPRSFAR